MFNDARIRVKLLSAFFAFAVLCLALVGFLAYRNGKQVLQEASFARLAAVRDTKARQLETHIEEIREQARALSENPQTVEAMHALVKAFRRHAASRQPVPETYHTALHGYYARELLPRLHAHTDGQEAMRDVWPKTPGARTLQVHYLAQNPHAIGKKDSLLQAEDGSAYSNRHAQYHPFFRDHLDRLGYDDLMLVDAESGHIVYSVRKAADFATSLRTGPHAQTLLGTLFQEASGVPAPGHVRLADFAPYAPAYARPASFVAAPVFDGSERLGVLVFRLGAEHVDRVLAGSRGWATQGLGRSGAAYLLGSDLAMRSNARPMIEDQAGFLDVLRFAGLDPRVIRRIERQGTTMLLRHVKTDAARAAVAGEQGQAVVRDHRGVPVLSAYTPLAIPDVDWALLTEIDAAEAFAPARQFVFSLARWGLGLLALASLLALLLSRHFTRPLRALTHAADALRDGRLDVAVEVRGRDEIGHLTEAFNALADQLRTSTDRAPRPPAEPDEALRPSPVVEEAPARALPAKPTRRRERV